VENFTFDVIANSLSCEDGYKSEQELIKQYKTHISLGGYNVEFGGNLSGKRSKETCDKISKSNKGNNRNLGFKHGKEFCDKMSQLMTGERNHRFGKPAANRKFDLEKCEEIIKLYKTGLYSYKSLADIYQVSTTTISSVINKKY
jgi:hypothetical protein